MHKVWILLPELVAYDVHVQHNKCLFAALHNGAILQDFLSDNFLTNHCRALQEKCVDSCLVQAHCDVRILLLLPLTTSVVMMLLVSQMTATANVWLAHAMQSQLRECASC